MTVRFKLKTRKWRGRTSHGGGHKKKRRGGGSQGGRGFGGSHKHKFSHVVSIEPDHYGYKGFYAKQKKAKTINIMDIAKMNEKEIDLGKLGYDKLLGTGNIDRAVIIRVSKISAQAKKKIEKAGGKVEFNPKRVYAATKSFIKGNKTVAKVEKKKENEAEEGE